MADREGRMAGRRALITGAASGIGKATAEAFAREGAKLALVDRPGSAVKAVAEALGAVAIEADLADVPGLDGVVAAAAESLGGLDCLVNCAGVSKNAPIGDIDLATYEWLMTINLTAPYFLCRAALPWLRQREGSSIVNIGSGASLVPHFPNNTLYATSKGGLVIMTKALASELVPHVRVNAVCPGATVTPMTADSLRPPGDGKPPPFLSSYPMKRAAEPEEIADAILFLASDEASYVNGVALAVDGGRCLH